MQQLTANSVAKQHPLSPDAVMPQIKKKKELNKIELSKLKS